MTVRMTGPAPLGRRPWLLTAVMLAVARFGDLAAQDTYCADTLDSMGTLCVTSTGSDGTCLGRCMTAVGAFNHSCWDHPSLGTSATVLTELIAACPEVRGCMDERYSNYRDESNSQQQGDCIDADAPVFQLTGDRVVTAMQACGLSFRRLAPCGGGNANYSDPWASAMDVVDGNLSAAIRRSGEVDLRNPGTYMLTYSVVDLSGNSPPSLVRTVSIIGYGCTNSSSYNYDPAATVEAGNCVDFLFGCQDPAALNFDWSANTDGCVSGVACNNQAVMATTSSVLTTGGSFESRHEFVGLDQWCECSLGYSDPHCSTNLDDCAMAPCSEHTTECSDVADSFYCLCESGWRGTTCSEEVTPCPAADNMCSIRDSCFVDDGGATGCDCAAGFVWNDTAVDCVAADRCASLPCLYGGTCIESTHVYECICAVGFEGANCELSSTICSPNSCIARVHGCRDPTMWNFAANANTPGGCEDAPGFLDELGIPCSGWAGYSCTDWAEVNSWDIGYTEVGLAATAMGCRNTCGLCATYAPACSGMNDMQCATCIPYSYGCKDASQFNFDPGVNTDNDSCEPFVYGCTDPTAFNHDPAANCGSTDWYRAGSVLRRCELTDVW